MTVEDLEKAVAKLSPEDLCPVSGLVRRIRTRPSSIARSNADAHAGRLDQLAEQALADFRQGRAREL